MTVNEIVTTVEDLLSGAEGRDRVARLTELFARLVAEKKSLDTQMKRLGRRPDVAFYLAAGDVRTGTIDVDVRIAGERCGRIHLDAGEDRLFAPAANHRDLWGGNRKRLEWRDPKVRKFLGDAAKRISLRQREATIESAFLVELAKSSSKEKQEHLLHHQPVLLGGVPFQFPLPMSGHAEPRLPKGSNAAGHADVLARRVGRRLRVFEVKKPGAPKTVHALRQAVAYAATLRRLLAESPHVYFPMLGYSPTHPPLQIDAVALVDEGDREGVRRAAEPLLAENGHFGLYVMGYTFNGKRRLEITGEDELGKARA